MLLGTVRDILVRAGDNIKVGQPIVHIDTQSSASADGSQISMTSAVNGNTGASSSARPAGTGSVSGAHLSPSGAPSRDVSENRPPSSEVGIQQHPTAHTSHTGRVPMIRFRYGKRGTNE